jgi:hypothetical protein
VCVRVLKYRYIQHSNVVVVVRNILFWDVATREQSHPHSSGVNNSAPRKESVFSLLPWHGINMYPNSHVYIRASAPTYVVVREGKRQQNICETWKLNALHFVDYHFSFGSQLQQFIPHWPSISYALHLHKHTSPIKFILRPHPPASEIERKKLVEQANNY